MNTSTKAKIEQKRFFYSPDENTEWMLTGDKKPDPKWVPISEFKAQQLIDARKRNHRIYLGANGQPTIWMTPIKPLLGWYERAELTPFIVKDGVASEEWVVSQIERSELLAQLAKLRWDKTQADTYVTEDGFTFRTDDVTYESLKGPAALGLQYPKQIVHWKFSAEDIVEFTAIRMVDIFNAIELIRQKHRAIEAYHIGLVLKGTPAKIVTWQLPEG